MTHNLYEWSRGDPNAAPARYVLDFQEWARERIERRDLDALVDYRARSAGGARAHPTEEHFLTLFVALGAGGERARPERLYNAVEGGVLAMDAYFFHPAG
jgi:4,5-DOPA dioxygenase extradiol